MDAHSAINWLEYFRTTEKDARLNIWHLALLSSLILIAYYQNESKIIRVSRSRIMAVSHISNLSTYHKYFKELQNFGYIKYTPSYHPGYRSTVEFLELNL